MRDFESIENAIAALKANKPIIITDDSNRENEGDLIFPAELVSQENISFMLKHCSGIICLAITPSHADKLELSLMVKTVS